MFNSVLEYFPPSLKAVFNLIDINVISKITEIRFHRGKAVILTIRNSAYFIDINADLHTSPDSSCVVITNGDFDELFMSLCSYSIYNNLDTLKKGYITLPSGIRAGVSSSAVFENEKMISVKNVTSISLRIPRQIKGCASAVLNALYVNSFPSIIVAGAPNSGKTTLLRDIAYELSNGFCSNFRKVCIVDERNEICAKNEGEYLMNTGLNCDVLTGFKKAQGIEIATRSLSPEMIVCDEISNLSEVQEIRYSFSSGCAFALSVHIGSKSDLYSKTIVKELLKTNEFSFIVLLDKHTYKTTIIDAKEIYETIGNGNSDNMLSGGGLSFIRRD